MINQLKFDLKMLKRYEKKYSNLPTDILADIVDTVLNQAGYKYFNWEQVQEHSDFCKQCGLCCRTVDCQYFNGKTCDEYATRFEACKDFPWYEINDDSGITPDPDCNFAVKLAEMVLDKEFAYNMSLLEVD